MLMKSLFMQKNTIFFLLKLLDLVNFNINIHKLQCKLLKKLSYIDIYLLFIFVVENFVFTFFVILQKNYVS